MKEIRKLPNIEVASVEHENNNSETNENNKGFPTLLSFTIFTFMYNVFEMSSINYMRFSLEWFLKIASVIVIMSMLKLSINGWKNFVVLLSTSMLIRCL